MQTCSAKSTTLSINCRDSMKQVTVHPVSERLFEYPSSSYHYTQTIRFFILAVIVALAASITCVNACQGSLQSCETTSDCCEGYDLICVTFVSRSGLLCIDFTRDDSSFATQHSGNKVCYTSNTPVSQMSTVALVLLIEPHVGWRFCS